jgi:hypothetical protein
MESLQGLLEIARTYFGATPWWPVMRDVGALAVLAALLRFIGDRLPFIPIALRRAAAWSGTAVVRATRASALWLKNALTYKRAREPRWVKPVGLWMDLLLGSYFGLLFSLMFIQYSGLVIYADGSKPAWKYFVVAALAFVVLIAARIFIVQARDAWCEIRDRVRHGSSGGGPREMKLLPSRTGPANP